MPQMVRSAGIPGDAARTLLDLSSGLPDGTWHLQPDDPEAPDIRIQLEAGRLVDLDRPGQPSVLHRALILDGPLRPRERDRWIKRGADLGSCPGLLCLEEQGIDASVAGEQIGKIIDEDLVLVLGAGDATWSGPSMEPILSGLHGRVDLGDSLEEVLFRSASRHRLWEGITDLPMMRDVVAATPSAMSIISDPQAGAEEKVIIEVADGHKDIAEIVGGRPDPWRALDRLLGLLEEGYLETQSAMELFRNGESALAQGQPATALRRWRRAEELGLDDFDLGARIGEACAATGRSSEATRRLRAHAQRCSEQVRIEAARDAWTGVVLLDPTDVEARQRALTLWVRNPGDDPKPAAQLAQALIDAGSADSACQLLDSIGAHLPDPQLHSLHQQAAQASGDPEAAQRARWRQAEALRATGQWSDATELYQQLAAENDQTSLLMLRLAESALQRSASDMAQEYTEKALHNESGTLRPLDPASREAIHIILQHEDAPATLHCWNADDARTQQQPQREAEARRHQWHAHCCESNIDAAREAARRCHELSPGVPDIALERSQLEERAGQPAMAAIILESLLHELPTDHPAVPAAVKSLLALDRTRKIALQHSLQLSDPDSTHHQATQLALGLIQVVEGESFTASPEAGAQAMVLGIISALLETGPAREDALTTIADQLSRHPDPLVHLLCATVAKHQPDHPLLQRATQPPAASARPAAVVRSSIGNITDKLRGVQTSPGEPTAADPTAPVQELPESPPQQSPATPAPNQGIQASLNRLRSLRGDTSPPPQSPQGETPEPEPGPDPVATPAALPPPVATGSLQSAASKLGSLRGPSNES